MDISTERLNALLKQIKISNAALAKTLGIDPSLVSRWTTGGRLLRYASDMTDRLARYLLDRILYEKGEIWLSNHIELDRNADLLNSLKIWISFDGKSAGKSLGVIYRYSTPAFEDMNRVRTGVADIKIYLDRMLAKTPKDACLEIHLSNEDAGLLTYEAVSQALIAAMNDKGLRIRLVVTLSGNTLAASSLLSRYIQPIIEGSLDISVVHGITQSVTNQTTFIFEEKGVLIVCETPKNFAPPVGMPSEDPSFITECRKSFKRALNYSQPLFQRYYDYHIRNIIEILYGEFATPGNLDIIKDSVNPMYMTTDAYDRYLRTLGHTDEQLEWISAEFARFKTAMDENLRGETVFREIVPLERLTQIVEDGYCRMPALYFMATGIAKLDAEGCLSVIEGYADYLTNAQNFKMLIVEDVPELNENNCWHLKLYSHMLINRWSSGVNIMLYSGQLMLTHELQKAFDNIWNREYYSEGRREKTILTLRELAARLKASHLTEG
jgi:transcriptional regulator with XRE-family HTH domain